MCRRTWVMVALLCAVVVSSIDVAEAQRRRRRRGRTTNNYNYYDYGNYGNASYYYPHWTPAKIDPDSANYPSLPISYSYDDALSKDAAFADRIRVFLRLDDSQALTAGKDLVAEVKIADLGDLETSHVAFVPVSLSRGPNPDDSSARATFDIGNDDLEHPMIKSARVYRLFINLHHKSEEYGAKSVLGRVPSPYYTSTSGDTPLEQGRRRIVMRTFKEWYYTERGWWSEQPYVMDCVAFYCWAAGSCTVGAEFGHARLDRLFGAVGYHNGASIPEFHGQESIHGDYVRIPGHSFMVLAFDAKKHQVITMEGNYNSSIEVAVRPLDDSWTVGHLVSGHFDAEMLEYGSNQGSMVRSWFGPDTHSALTSLW